MLHEKLLVLVGKRSCTRGRKCHIFNVNVNYYLLELIIGFFLFSLSDGNLSSISPILLVILQIPSPTSEFLQYSQHGVSGPILQLRVPVQQEHNPGQVQQSSAVHTCAQHVMPANRTWREPTVMGNTFKYLVQQVSD